MSQIVMPVLFVGHGSPMNAVEDNGYSQTWESLGKNLPRPKAILCISAHWETAGTQITAMDRPRTIHDFGGFPHTLFEKEYPTAGDPSLAIDICSTVKTVTIRPDLNRGLDHGAWSVLCRMYPQADIPVLQLSLDLTRDGNYHYNLGRELRFLRTKDVLILGSGNVVHNLRMISWGAYPFDWAEEFDRLVRQKILDGDHQALIRYADLGKNAALSINSAEHYLPLLYILGAMQQGESVSFFNESIMAGSISMRGVVIGA
ncbi:MAG: 4,5-DOPA dioxygenase extradiol [Leptolinea sp.]|jgi:4,5-DOPA dioxygenase extradiol|nr:4,5-DOPA dioxygenase extradiol [Leptolinea sp.]